MKPSPFVIVGLVVVGVLVLAAVALFPRLATAVARDQALSRCDALRQERSRLAVQGGDVVEIARLDAQIRACTTEAASLGANVDLGSETLKTCLAKSEQIEQEWAHYRSTGYDDAVKRNNTRGTMLRLGEELARCFSQAVTDAQNVVTLRQIRDAVSQAIGRAQAREQCYLSDASGCGRFGLNEPHGNDKAADERARVITPLRDVLSQVNDAIRNGRTPA